MKKILVLLCALLLPCVGHAEVVERMLPDAVTGVSKHAIVLNGDWQFRFSPQSKWTSVQVPGELAMQGFAVKHDKPMLYKKQFTLPADYAGQRTILRFDGVYSHARLWVNDTYVREHFGGFTRWEADVTELVKPGKRNEIRVEVTDRIDDPSYGSGYAHHPIGGILRDVTVYALPKAGISNFAAETLLDTLYQDAELRLSYTLSGEAVARFTLVDAQGREVALKSVGKKDGRVREERFAVSRPAKWDAEHPNLYTLNVSVEDGGKQTYHFSRKIGFRDVKITGNRMFVNGQQVKLRGACRHDIHPTLGRTTTAELDSLDALIFKRTNMNFVRTSHYPPTERFLRHCDEMGLYVECETAVCFVDTYRQKNYAPAASQSDPAFTDRYMSQLQEMVIGFRSHASILFWSVGNECQYGSNFQQSYDWVKQTDTTRPAIFSYPGYVEKGKKAFDILSLHYPGVEGTMNQMGAITTGFQNKDYPSLFDEWAHVPCYTYTTLQDDPNIREFWGISLDKMWSNLFDAPGGLGGAIWGYIDETFMLPQPKVGKPYWIEFARTAKPADFQGNCVGYGEWGVVDVWRREKPEFWGTKKAYSPIRLLQTDVPDFTTGEPLLLPIYNRFDHTNLSEVTIRFKQNDIWHPVPAPDVAPHRKGLLQLPASAWCSGDAVQVEFLTASGALIDAYTVSLGTSLPITPLTPASASLTIEETAAQVVVKGDDFVIPFDKQTGLIVGATSKGEVVIERGPFLNLDLNVSHKTGAEVREKAANYIVADTDWQKTAFTHRQKGNQVTVLLKGFYKGIALAMSINIQASGEMTFDYQTVGEPNGWLRESGLKFYLPAAFNKLNWVRKGYWSSYPEGDFAGNRGTVSLYNDKVVPYGTDPAQSWNLDTHNYYYFADAGAICNRPLTNIAKGMKENIFSYTLTAGQQGTLSVVSSSAALACRLNKPVGEQLILYINNRWDYPEIAWGDYCKALDVTPNFGRIMIRL